MSNSLEERRAQRLQFLHAVYEESDGSAGQFVRLSDMAEKLGLDERRADEVADYLVNEGLLEWVMLEEQFDHIRDAILGSPREGFFLMGRKGDPDYTGTELVYNLVSDDEGRTRMLVGANLFGLHMATDSRLPSPLVPVPDDLALLVRFGHGDFVTARRSRKKGRGELLPG